tara:strand:- start:309 stop:455 length:147 start_codon:yes stop_codon:yes gene_type:complete
MATPQEKLAQSLEVLKALQDKGHTAITFAKFISWLVEKGMKGTPVAKV